MSTLLSHSGLPRDAELATSKVLHPMYACEIQYLVKPSLGWNFSTQTVMPDDIDDFDISDMIQDTTDNTPMVSALLDTLLQAYINLSSSVHRGTGQESDPHPKRYWMVFDDAGFSHGPLTRQSKSRHSTTSSDSGHDNAVPGG